MSERLQDGRLDCVIPTRLLIFDRVFLYRANLSRYIVVQPGLEMVGEFLAALDALCRVEKSDVDVVLLDLEAGSRSEGTAVGGVEKALSSSGEGISLPVAIIGD